MIVNLAGLYLHECFVMFLFRIAVILICADQGIVRKIMLDALDMGFLNWDYAFVAVDVTRGE
jgi:hypothetical protein